MATITKSDEKKKIVSLKEEATEMMLKRNKAL